MFWLDGIVDYIMNIVWEHYAHLNFEYIILQKKSALIHYEFSSQGALWADNNLTVYAF